MVETVFVCSCGMVLKVYGDDQAGQNVICPSCGAGVIVPATSMAVPAPILHTACPEASLASGIGHWLVVSYLLGAMALTAVAVKFVLMPALAPTPLVARNEVGREVSADDDRRHDASGPLGSKSTEESDADGPESFGGSGLGDPDDESPREPARERKRRASSSDDPDPFKDLASTSTRGYPTAAPPSRGMGGMGRGGMGTTGSMGRGGMGALGGLGHRGMGGLGGMGGMGRGGMGGLGRGGMGALGRGGMGGMGSGPVPPAATSPPTGPEDVSDPAAELADPEGSSGDGIERGGPATAKRVTKPKTSRKAEPDPAYKHIKNPKVRTLLEYAKANTNHVKATWTAENLLEQAEKIAEGDPDVATEVKKLRKKIDQLRRAGP